MDKRQSLAEYRNIVGKDSAKAREIIKKLDYKNDYYLLKCIAQTYLDESRFENDDTLRGSIDKRKWRLAEKYIINAYNLNSEDAEVLYTMGEIRKMFEAQTALAIFCFEKIISFNINNIAYSEYGRGISFAKELINDSRFELYRLYHEEDKKLALEYLKEYKSELEKGVQTLFKPLKKYIIN